MQARRLTGLPLHGLTQTEFARHPLLLRMRPGYDHSYYFIASFLGEHLAHHAAALAG